MDLLKAAFIKFDIPSVWFYYDTRFMLHYNGSLNTNRDFRRPLTEMGWSKIKSLNHRYIKQYEMMVEYII